MKTFTLIPMRDRWKVGYNLSMPFLPLNTITAYDFGESIILPSSYVKRGKELGYTSLGIADQNRYAFPSFADACEKEKIKPVFGLRISLSSAIRDKYDAVLYIKNEKGYQNLCDLLSKKRDKYGTDTLLSHKDGLILVLCRNDPLFYQEEYQTRISKELTLFKRIFQDDFYLGLRLESKADREESPLLFRFIDDREYQAVAFPCSRYLFKNDAGSYRLFTAAWKKEKYQDGNEVGPEFLLSDQGIEKTYREKEIKAAQEIADKTDFSFFTKRGSRISFDHADELLNEKAVEGLQNRFLGKEIPSEYKDRLQYELSIIKKRNFSSYFLLVEDYVSHARREGIYVGPGRGSAGGSLVSYSLNITQMDPRKYSLSFERFLNPKRKTRPDIDRDFEDTRRSEVVSYLKQRYGESHCGEIVTFSCLKPRSAINLIGTALGYSPSRLKPLTSLLPEQADDFTSAKEQRRYYQKVKFESLRKDDYYASLVKRASLFIGLPVNTSIHAAGVILSQDEIYKNVPRSRGKSGTVLYEYPYRERLGYLKVDILSLSNLSFIREIEERIKKNGKELPDIRNDLENKKVFEERNSLHLARIFQLDNSFGFRKAIEEIHPDSFKDIASLLALYRPGPRNYISSFAKRKKGREKIEYKSPLLEPILRDTYGIRIYQEQVRSAVVAVASFSSSDADLFRRAISKKDVDKRKQYEPLFYQGAKKNGVREDLAKSIYEDVLKFAGYGFNKSHAYCYAYLTYMLLYYKANYPQEFYEAAFSSNTLGSLKSLQLRQELKDNRIKRIRPDINTSKADDYLLRNNQCFIPLSVIKQSDKKLLSVIVDVREEKGAFTSYYDFFLKRDGKRNESSLKTLTSLIEAGAFDSLSPYREERKKNLSLYRSYASMSFPRNQIPARAESKEDYGIRLSLEKEMLGIIRSIPLTALIYKKGYKTFIVSDTSYLETNGMVTIIREVEEYKAFLNGRKNVEKGGILLIKEDDVIKGKSYLYPHNCIYLGKEEK